MISDEIWSFHNQSIESSANAYKVRWDSNNVTGSLMWNILVNSNPIAHRSLISEFFLK